jgi:hypothetical protein
MLVMVAWVFFRANSINDAIYILQQFPKVVQDISGLSHPVRSLGINFTMNPVQLATAFFLIFFLEAFHYLQIRKNITQIFERWPTFIRWSVYYAAILIILFMGVFENRQFIYFQF